MPSPRRKFISGQELAEALAKMGTTVKWLVGGECFHIPAAQAVYIVKSTSHEGKFHNGRVYFIRELVTRATPVFVEEYRRDRAILCFNKPVDARTVDLWDRVLGNPKAKPVYSNIVPSGTAEAASARF